MKALALALAILMASVPATATTLDEAAAMVRRTSSNKLIQLFADGCAGPGGTLCKGTVFLADGTEVLVSLNPNTYSVIPMANALCNLGWPWHVGDRADIYCFGIQ